jgi:hypothetical protein
MKVSFVRLSVDDTAPGPSGWLQHSPLSRLFPLVLAISAQLKPNRGYR